jgi:preprotein translocase subunit SecD
MSDARNPNSDRKTLTPSTPASLRHNAAAVAAGVALVVMLAALAGVVVYLLAGGTLGRRPSVRVVLRVLRPTRFEFRIARPQADRAAMQAKLLSALAPELRAHRLRIWLPAPDRLVIDGSAPDEKALAAQAALLQRRLKPLPYGLELVRKSIAAIKPDDLMHLGAVLERRGLSLGIPCQIQIAPQGRIIVLVRASEPRRAVRSLTAQGRLEFVQIPRRYTAEAERDPETGRESTSFADRSGKRVSAEQVLADSPVIVTGADLRDNARVIFDPVTRDPEVAIAFRPEGGEKLHQFTRTHVNSCLGIVLDGEVIAAPAVRAAIRDQAVIRGGFATNKEALQLADLLNAGALQFEVEVESVQAPPRRR